MASRWVVAIGALAGLLLVLPAAADARSFTVNSLGDGVGGPANGVCDLGGGVCTLREAMLEQFGAPGPEDDTITIDVNGTIDLATPISQINADTTTIVGPGADKLTIRRTAVPGFGIFTVNGSGDLRLVGVTVTNGQAGATGGAVHVSAANTLTLEKVSLTGNKAINPGSAGGAVYSVGTVLVDQSTIFGNAAGNGGGLGIFGGTATVTRSTITGNTATSLATPGGGVAVFDASATILGSTVAANQAPASGGADIQSGGTATVTLKSSIVADPIGAPSCLATPSGTFVSQGFNVREEAACGPTLATDITADPKLGPLNGNGGPTATMALLEGSPAIDSGLASGLGSGDQRGFDRPADFANIANAAGGDGGDVGAYEVQLPPVEQPDVECRGKNATIVGSEGDDPLKGTPGKDVIAALGGRDTVTGRGGNDIVCGGNGNDVLQGAGGRDRLYGELGKDRLRGGGGKGDLCSGGGGKDTSVGSCEKEKSA